MLVLGCVIVILLLKIIHILNNKATNIHNKFIDQKLKPLAKKIDDKKLAWDYQNMKEWLDKKQAIQAQKIIKPEQL